jgi:hypothetical protein
MKIPLPKPHMPRPTGRKRVAINLFVLIAALVGAYFLVAAISHPTIIVYNESYNFTRPPAVIEDRPLDYHQADFPAQNEIEIPSISQPLFTENVPVFQLPMRYYVNETKFEYFDENSTARIMEERIVNASFFAWLNSSDGLLPYYRVNRSEDANFIVTFVHTWPGRLPDDWRTGTGKPLVTMEYKNFTIIYKSELNIFSAGGIGECEIRETTTREIGRALGFDYDEFVNTSSVMQRHTTLNGSRCIADIDKRLAADLKAIYNAAKPDLGFAHANARYENGTYSFDVMVRNTGITASPATILSAYEGEEITGIAAVPPIDVASQYLAIPDGVKMRANMSGYLQVFIDPSSTLQEITKSDNTITLVPSG